MGLFDESINSLVTISFPTFRLLKAFQLIILIVTEVVLPGDVIVWVTCTLLLESNLIIDRTVVKWNMIISKIIKEMDFVLVHEECDSN